MSTKEPDAEVIWRDLRPVLHQEVNRLPERYRLPFVLCYLEGKTNEEAATLLGWPKGTVLSSLSRARERLRQRLTQHGLALTSSVFAMILSQQPAEAALPPLLIESTLHAALHFAKGPGTVGSIAAPVLTYAEEMLHAIRVAQLKWTALILLTVTVAGLGTSGLIHLVQARAPENVGHQREASQTRFAPENVPPDLQAVPQIVLDEDRLQGAWRVTTAEQRGQRVDILNGRCLLFTGNHFSLNAGQGEVPGIISTAAMEGDFTLKPGNPKSIDLTKRSGPLHGIYSLEGTKVRLCLSRLFEKERPQDFSTKTTSNSLFILLEREENP
jgi:uncharacterized protein (TIGR03067 family)